MAKRNVAMRRVRSLRLWKRNCAVSYTHLRGVNIGGLGTLIASLASLISYKFFAESQARFPEAGSKQSYILRFTIWNVGMAIILLLAAVMLDW